MSLSCLSVNANPRQNFKKIVYKIGANCSKKLQYLHSVSLVQKQDVRKKTTMKLLHRPNIIHLIKKLDTSR